LQLQQSDKRPPFTWPLTVPKTTQRLHEVEAFNAATRAMRRRQQGESLRLDVEATISATIARSGFPALKFCPISKVPEYLILIDRATLADHQARFFEDFAARLRNEDVFVESYFYDGDPRVCYRGDYRTGVLLEDLPRHGHRLLVYGNGTRLLEPASGELEEWAEWFADWDDRALLTPVAPVQWGLRERKLSELFLVLPATLEGLRETLSHFELRNRPDLRAWRQRSDENKLPVFDYDSSAEKTADKLQAYLNDDNLFQWICSCAAYPTLQWNLTLCLGEQVMPGGELWEKDILRLARLPWFQQGVMPEELRHCLLRRLAPENYRKVSARLVELLRDAEKNLPEKFDSSWAKESLNLQIEIQQWLANRTDEQASLLRRKFRELPPSLTARDYATLRDVDAEPLSPRTKSLLKRLPESWRNRLYPHGLPPLGLKPATLFSLATPLALLLAISVAMLKPAAQTIFIEQQPTEEYVAIASISVTPSPEVTPTPGVTPSPTPKASPSPSPVPGNAVTCFSPNAEIAIAERNVSPDAYVPLDGNVQGGQNYGDLSLKWESSPGKIKSGVSRAGKKINSLDITGIALGTTIYVNLRVTSSLGNCSATAQTSIRIVPPSTPTPTPLPTPTPILMPTLTGQDVSSARRTLESLGLKLQIDTPPVTNSQNKPDVVVQQDPNGGTALSPGQKVTLYVARQVAVTTCYTIKLERIEVNQDGEVGSPKWSFDIFAAGAKVITLPAEAYSDRKASGSSQSAPQKNPYDLSKVPPGTGCVPEGQLISISVVGTNVGENDPAQRTANGNQSEKLSTQPVTVYVRVKTRNPKDGDFNFTFTITPTRPPSAR
jgi:hypothetical protein